MVSNGATNGSRLLVVVYDDGLVAVVVVVLVRERLVSMAMMMVMMVVRVRGVISSRSGAAASQACKAALKVSQIPSKSIG